MTSKPLAPTYHDVQVDTRLGNATVHYAEAGDKSRPTLLLLMGFPSSSTQYRDFMSLMADKHRVLAPDFPGFGLTKVSGDFTYTFDNIAVVISAWIEKLGVSYYAMYIFDYGSPIGFRLALEKPSAVKAIISQNGNAYDEGFGKEAWAPIFNLWETNNSQEAREALRNGFLTLEATMFQYYHGVPEADKHLVDPEQPVRDYLQNLAGRENQERQLDLFYDYRTNTVAYPKWHQYLDASSVPLLAVWGKGDPLFIAPGAEAYKQHSKNAEVHYVDAGHFALETSRWEIAEMAKKFLNKIEF